MPARADAPRRRVWPAVVLLAVITGAVPLVRLLEIPPQAPLRSWLIEEPSALVPRPVELAPAASGGDADTLYVTLVTPDAAVLTTADRLEVAMATYETPVRLRRAALRDPRNGCGFAAAPGTPLVNNQLLPLERTTPCPPGPATLRLEAQIVAGSGRVAVWALEDPAGAGRLLEVESAQEPRLVVRGQHVRRAPPSQHTRADLLAAMWQVTPRTLWRRAAIIGALLAGALALIAASQRGSGPGARAIGALGIGALMGALAMATALVVPPLQASDEPSHMLSQAQRSQHPTWAAQTEALARRAHFERLRHHGDQHFRASDIDTPWPVAWSLSIAPVDVGARSRLTAWWWDALTPWLRDAPVHDALWRMRLANATLFASVIALAAWLLAWLLPARAPALATLGLLVVPTLPYYGMLWGDTPVILSASVLLAATVTPVVLGSARTWLAGAPMGLAIVLVLLSGRRAWPLLMAVAAVLVAMPLGFAASASWRQRRWFWAGLGLVLTPAAMWVHQLGILDDSVALLAGRATWLAAVADAAIARPWTPAVGLLVLAALDWWRDRARRIVPADAAGARAEGRGAATLLRVAAVLLLGLTLLSAVVPLPTTNGVLVDAVSLGDYLRSVAMSMLAPFRLGHHDLLLSTFFWSGLGWVDIVVPPWLLGALALTSAIAVATWWWACARPGSGPHPMLTLALLLGLAAALMTAAVGAYALHYELYGRYLLGWYLLLLLPAWAHAAGNGMRWSWWLGPPLAAHGYTLQLVLLRYF